MAQNGNNKREFGGNIGTGLIAVMFLLAVPHEARAVDRSAYPYGLLDGFDTFEVETQ